GAFFLHDTVNSRWFCAPFYELLNHAPAPNEPKPTFVRWPQYLTAESVAVASRDLALVAKPTEARPKKSYERPWLRSSTREDTPRRVSPDALSHQPRPGPSHKPPP